MFFIFLPKIILLRKIILEIFSISKNNIICAKAITALQYSQQSRLLTCFSTVTFAIFQSERCYNSSLLSLCCDGGLKLSRNMQVLNSQFRHTTTPSITKQQSLGVNFNFSSKLGIYNNALMTIASRVSNSTTYSLLQSNPKRYSITGSWVMNLK